MRVERKLKPQPDNPSTKQGAEQQESKQQESKQPVTHRPDESGNKKDGQGDIHRAMRQESGGQRGFERGEIASDSTHQARQAEAAHRERLNRSTAPQVEQQKGPNGCVVAKVKSYFPAESPPTRKDAEECT